MKNKYIKNIAIAAICIFVFFIYLLPLYRKPGYLTDGVAFSDLKEFKENFSKFMAFPSYIPFDFDRLAEYESYYIPYNERGFKKSFWFVRIPNFAYKRVDITDCVKMEYSSPRIIKKLTEKSPYELSKVVFLYLPNTTLEDVIVKEELEHIKHKDYLIYYDEYLGSKLLTPEAYPDSTGTICLCYFMSLDDKVYEFIIFYDVLEGTSNEKLFELRDKLKEEALQEVIKSYESLKYVKKK